MRGIIRLVPLLVALALVPAGAGAAPRAVAGAHSAYHGALARKAPRAVRRFYLTGMPQDQISKLDGIGTASFAARRPAADQPYMQETSPFAYTPSAPAWNSPFV